MTALYYEEFEVDRAIEHKKRRAAPESDNQRFCDMTMNQQPLHPDAEFAASSQFDRRLVNDLYTTSLTVGLSIPDTMDGAIVANLSYDDVSHPDSVFHGDTFRTQTAILDKRETSDSERGVVTVKVETFNQDDDLVCEFERTALSLRHEFAVNADDA